MVASLVLLLLIENFAVGFSPIPTFPPEKERFSSRVLISNTPSTILFQAVAVSHEPVPTLSAAVSPQKRAPYPTERIKNVPKNIIAE